MNNINDAPNFALSTTALVVDEDFGSTQVTIASSDDGDGSQPLSIALARLLLVLPRCRLMANLVR